MLLGDLVCYIEYQKSATKRERLSRLSLSGTRCLVALSCFFTQLHLMRRILSGIYRYAWPYMETISISTTSRRIFLATRVRSSAGLLGSWIGLWKGIDEASHCPSTTTTTVFVFFFACCRNLHQPCVPEEQGGDKRKLYRVGPLHPEAFVLIELVCSF